MQFPNKIVSIQKKKPRPVGLDTDDPSDFNVLLTPTGYDCPQCNEKLELMNRPTHCLACGDLICDSCAQAAYIPKLFYNSKKSVCDLCKKILSEEEKEIMKPPKDNNDKWLRLKIVIVAYETSEQDLELYVSLANQIQKDGNLVVLISDKMFSDYLKRKAPHVLFCGVESELEQIPNGKKYKEAQKEGKDFSFCDELSNDFSFFTSFLNTTLVCSKDSDIMIVGNQYDFVGITVAQFYNIPLFCINNTLQKQFTPFSFVNKQINSFLETINFFKIRSSVNVLRGNVCGLSQINFLRYLINFLFIFYFYFLFLINFYFLFHIYFIFISFLFLFIFYFYLNFIFNFIYFLFLFLFIFYFSEVQRN